MAEADIPAQEHSSRKSIPTPAPSSFEVWAQQNSYNIAPAVCPSDIRTYADRETQTAYAAWKDGAAQTARMMTQSTLETDTLREQLQPLTCSK